MGKTKRILIVDDEELNRELLEGVLTYFGYESEVATNGQEALLKINEDIDLVLLDVVMPGMDGFEVARSIRAHPQRSDVPIIMVTALGSKADRLRAVAVGANDFVAKPLDKTELRVRMNSQLKLKDALDIIKGQRTQLEKLVEKRTRALRKALDKIVAAQRKTQKAHLDTVHRLALAAEYKDQDTAAHIRRISHYCTLLARAFHLSANEIELGKHASPMHDIGKIGIPDAILLKPGKLNPREWATMREHTVIGARILHGSTSELLQVSEIIALSHHEKWDGSGYPKGLAGQEIPLWGRICAVADAFDALTSKRPYKDAYSNEEALAIMKKERARHFDPQLLDVFVERFNEVIAIKENSLA